MSDNIFPTMPAMTPQVYNPNQSADLKVKNELGAKNIEDKCDSVEITKCNHQQPKRTISSTIGDIKRGWVTLTQMSKGAAKGIGTGVVAGSLVYTGYSGFNAIKSTIGKIAKKPMKTGKPVVGAIMGAVAFAVSLGYNLWTAKLNTNVMTAQIDHKYNTGHDTV